jgi:acyl-CoA synthetase (AMP-forming)/AMP-acid ligase II
VAPLIGTDGRPEVDLVAFPVFVIANLGQGITSVLPNWPLRVPRSAKAAAIRAHAERHGVTRMLLSPAVAETLAETGMPAGVHTMFTGGGPVFPDLIERLRSRRPSMRLLCVYGSTEAEPIAHFDAAEMSGADCGAMASGAGLLAGTPVDSVRVRIVDGEILVAGDHVVGGYLDPAHDATTKVRDADGAVWHRTGDAGRFDGAGRLWLRGRRDGCVGGLWPFEIEAMARRWPGVRRAALSDILGEATLAIEGDPRHRPHWQDAASAAGVRRLVRLEQIPVDRRHGSKIDQAALKRMLAG